MINEEIELCERTGRRRPSGSRTQLSKRRYSRHAAVGGFGASQITEFINYLESRYLPKTQASRRVTRNRVRKFAQRYLEPHARVAPRSAGKQVLPRKPKAGGERALRPTSRSPRTNVARDEAWRRRPKRFGAGSQSFERRRIDVIALTQTMAGQCVGKPRAAQRQRREAARQAGLASFTADVSTGNVDSQATQLAEEGRRSARRHTAHHAMATTVTPSSPAGIFGGADTWPTWRGVQAFRRRVERVRASVWPILTKGRATVQVVA